MVNEHRRGKKYADKDAAEEVLGKAEKDDLESDPLVRQLHSIWAVSAQF